MIRSSQKNAAQTSQLDRRSCERIHFTATAVVLDVATKSRLTGRVADLCRGGCYVDLMNPFPVGTSVTLQIEHSGKAFQADGIVTYALQRMGMGISFGEIAQENRTVLEQWLGIRPSDTCPAHNPQADTLAFARAEAAQRDVLKRLIEHLTKQRTIDEEVASIFLKDLSGQS